MWREKGHANAGVENQGPVQVPLIVSFCPPSPHSALSIIKHLHNKKTLSQMNRVSSIRAAPVIHSRLHYFSTERMAKTVQEALREGDLYSDKIQYTFLKLPVSSIDQASQILSSSNGKSESTTFRGLLVDKDEITMMIPKGDWSKSKTSIPALQENRGIEEGSCPYRMITFDVVMDPNLIGFMHTVTKTLAAESISVLPYAAYSRDHIFVQEGDYEKAMAALERLKKESSDAVE